MIIDAMFFLDLLVDPPSPFGLIARYILGRIWSTTSRDIRFDFDKTIHPSIKDCEKEMLDQLIDQIPTALLNRPKKDLATG